VAAAAIERDDRARLGAPQHQGKADDRLTDQLAGRELVAGARDVPEVSNQRLFHWTSTQGLGMTPERLDWGPAAPREPAAAGHEEGLLF
jgi:hypothetical protein